MTLEELARQVAAMRRKQKEYFQTRSSRVLNECRDWERRIDGMVASILQPPQPGLFDQKGNDDGN